MHSSVGAVAGSCPTVMGCHTVTWLLPAAAPRSSRAQTHLTCKLNVSSMCFTLMITWRFLHAQECALNTPGLFLCYLIHSGEFERYPLGVKDNEKLKYCSEQSLNNGDKGSDIGSKINFSGHKLEFDPCEIHCNRLKIAQRPHLEVNIIILRQIEKTHPKPAGWWLAGGPGALT